MRNIIISAIRKIKSVFGLSQTTQVVYTRVIERFDVVKRIPVLVAIGR